MSPTASPSLPEAVTLPWHREWGPSTAPQWPRPESRAAEVARFCGAGHWGLGPQDARTEGLLRVQAACSAPGLPLAWAEGPQQHRSHTQLGVGVPGAGLLGTPSPDPAPTHLWQQRGWSLEACPELQDPHTGLECFPYA